MSTETTTSPSDCMQYNQHHISDGQVSDSTVITTTFPTTSHHGLPSDQHPRGTSSDHLNIPNGRVSKPIRRRASRRAPTTLLKTDANNFRAMVQQFTGSPTQTLPIGFQNYFPSGENFNFHQGININHVQQQVNITNPAATHVAQNRYPLQFQQQQQQLRATNDDQQQYVFSSLNNFDHQVPAASAFLQRFDGSTNDQEHSNHNNML